MQTAKQKMEAICDDFLDKLIAQDIWDQPTLFHILDDIARKKHDIMIEAVQRGVFGAQLQFVRTEQ